MAYIGQIKDLTHVWGNTPTTTLFDTNHDGALMGIDFVDGTEMKYFAKLMFKPDPYESFEELKIYYNLKIRV